MFRSLERHCGSALKMFVRDAKGKADWWDSNNEKLTQTDIGHSHLVKGYPPLPDHDHGRGTHEFPGGCGLHNAAGTHQASPRRWPNPTTRIGLDVCCFLSGSSHLRLRLPNGVALPNLAGSV